MTLGELKSHIENHPNGTNFNYSLSNPFSWRGIYAEVAFAIEKIPSTKEELLKKVEMALNNTFTGYKGGDYKYSEYTDIHFEESIGRWTDGDYVRNLIEEITDEEQYVDDETKLIKLIF